MLGFSMVLDLPKHCDASAFDANQSPLRFVIIPGRLFSVLGNVLGIFDHIQGINVRIRSWTSVWRSNGRTPSPFQVLPRSSREVSDLLRGNGSEETKGFLSSHEFRQILTQKV